MRTRRNKGSSPAQLFEDAYSWQQGEFYPEHHQANIERLSDKYPEVSSAEIEDIYRKACTIEHEIRQQIQGAQLTAAARDALLEDLESQFYGFSRASLAWALQRAEAS